MKKVTQKSIQNSGGNSLVDVLAIICALLVLSAVLFLYFRGTMFRENNFLCKGNPQKEYHSSVTFTTEKFLLDTTKKELVTAVLADPSYKKVEKHDEVDASCPASTNYNGERYELTYIDPVTNQKTTVVAPKEFVTFETVSKNETPSVEIITIMVPLRDHYNSLVKQNKVDNQKVEINKYVVRS